MGNANKIMETLIKKAQAIRSPIKGSFELLPVCNLDCKMCYIRSSWNEVNQFGGLKTVDEWLEMAKQLKEAGTLFLLLTGGEVFLYPEFKRLYIELHKMGFIITINTNGTMINKNVVKWLKCYPPKLISLSLYGASNETYEKLCGAKGMFDKVTEAIKLLQKNNISVECKTVLTPLNYYDLQKCWDFVQERNIHYEVATYSFPPIRKNLKDTQIRFDKLETAKYFFYCKKILSNQEEYKEAIIKYLKKYENNKKIPGKINYGFNCSACNTQYWITWQGKMTPCALMVEPYTYPFKDGFLNAWEELKQKVDQIMLSTECSYCDKRQVCTVCPASAYAETGSFDGTSKYHCEMTDELLKEMRRYIKEENINIDEYDDNGEKK